MSQMIRRVAVNSALCCVLLLLICSCGQSVPNDFAFLSLSKKKSAQIFLGPNDTDAMVRITSRETKITIAEVQLRVPDVVQGWPWVGWSKDEQLLSVLVCGSEGPRTLRLSLEPGIKKNMAQEQASIAEADADLILSLKKLQAGVQWAKAREVDDVIFFYCSGYAGESMDQYLDPKKRRYTIS